MNLYLLSHLIFDGAFSEAASGFTFQAETDDQAAVISKRIRKVTSLRYPQLYDISTDDIRKVDISLR